MIHDTSIRSVPDYAFDFETMDSLASFSEDNISGLLEPPFVEYSKVTLRRAYDIWKQSGQKNRFKDICNYFHHLEALDLNLQSIRRELIAMLDDSDNIDCTSCKQFKCRCYDIMPIAQSCSERNSHDSISSHRQQDLNTSKKAPSAEVLPKPQSEELNQKEPVSSTPKKSADKNAWVRIVTTTALPNAPECNSARMHDVGKSSFNWPELKYGWDKRTLERQQNINGVRTYVRSVKNPSRPHSLAETNVSFVPNTLAAIQSNGYTYF